jgi:teichuronic acid biosynthesis glycosyltransferase TuaH
MARALSRYADVLWVDPPVSPVTPPRYARGASRVPWPTLSRPERWLVRLTPRALPLYSRNFVRPTTAPLLRLQIRWALRRLEVRPYAVVACGLDDLLGRWGPDVLDVLYGTDDYVSGAELMRLDRRRIEREEQVQLRNADLAVVVSQTLADRWRALGFERPLTVLPNGVDVAAYRGLDTVESPPGLELPRPVAGLVGQLSSRIDIGLLESVVAAGCSLLLVGPHDPAWEPERFARLIGRPRVRWVGAQPFAQLPRFLKVIDVGLTPYQDTPFNRASFPLKTLEYLAAGKPVVSTDLPAVRWLGTGLVTVADPAGFGEAARALGAAPTSEDLARERIAFASGHSWDQRADAFATSIGLRTAGA